MAKPMEQRGDRGERQLVEGCTVVIQGLVAAAQHNGHEGQLVRFDKDAGRWGVKLSSGEVRAIPSGRFSALLLHFLHCFIDFHVRHHADSWCQATEFGLR
jgi:hypothetical protein